MRPSSPRTSRISSTTARYSRSRLRVLPSTGTASGCSSTSTNRRPSGRVCAAPATPRWRPCRAYARPPPGMRTRSLTSATVPSVGEFVFVAGDQQHALFIAGVDRQRERHAREDDDVLQRDK